MKKIIIIFFILSAISFAGFRKKGGIKGLGEVIGLLTKIYTQQQLMGTEQIQQGLSLMNQIQNQVRQIENQYAMLKSLGQEISQGNLTNIESYYNEMGYMLNTYKSTMFDVENLSKKYKESFEKNPIEYEKLGFTKEYIEKMDKNIREARQESNNALYDVMTSKGFAAKLGADQQNLQTLLTASKNSTGVVEALQVTNNLLGQISTNISQLGLLTEAANKAQAMSSNTESQEIESSKQKLEEISSRQEKKEQEKVQELKKKNKSIRL